MKLNIEITVDQLKAFDAVVSEGSFAAAGAAIHRTTSAVSYAVRALEEALGLELFDRGGHRAALTPAGELVLDQARRLMDQAQHLTALAQELAGGWEPYLRIVIDGILPQLPVMRAAKRFREAGAPTRVQLRVEYLGGVRERFEADPADFMFVLDFAGNAEHVARPLAPVEMLLVAAAGHPLARLRRVQRADLAEHVELLVDDSSSGGAPPPGRLALGNPHTFRLSDFQSKRLALLEGVGFGWMPRHLVAEELRCRQITRVRYVEGDRYRFTPHLVYRRRSPLGRAAKRFLALLDEELARELAG